MPVLAVSCVDVEVFMILYSLALPLPAVSAAVYSVLAIIPSVAVYFNSVLSAPIQLA